MYDVIIVGSGAAGLFSAALLSRTGKKVLVIEQQEKSGKKLALCGGGSCNLGPVERESESLAARYQRFTPHPKTGLIRQEPVRSVKTLFYAYPPELVLRLWTETDTVVGPFRGLGIQLREEEGRLYPADFDAKTLAHELTERGRKAGVSFRYSTAVQGIARTGATFTLQIKGQAGAVTETIEGRTVILASGGFSYPAVGGNDSGLSLLAPFGTRVQNGHPAMGPLAIQNYPFAESSGTVIPARISVRLRGINPDTDGSKDFIRTGIDQLLFTHQGLSGPVVLDICGAVHEAAAEHPELVLDLVPALSRSELEELLWRFIQDHPGKKAVQLLTPFVPRTLASTLLSRSGMDPESVCAETGKTALKGLIEELKATKQIPRLPTGRHLAMSWTGGCECEELDFSTMELKSVPGLFVIGDMVSFCRPCGGYSLWFCWTSALAAALAAEKY